MHTYTINSTLAQFCHNVHFEFVYCVVVKSSVAKILVSKNYCSLLAIYICATNRSYALCQIL